MANTALIVDSVAWGLVGLFLALTMLRPKDEETNMPLPYESNNYVMAILIAIALGAGRAFLENSGSFRGPAVGMSDVGANFALPL